MLSGQSNVWQHVDTTANDYFLDRMPLYCDIDESSLIERLALLTELVFFKAVALSYNAGDIHRHCWWITSSTIPCATSRPELLLD